MRVSAIKAGALSLCLLLLAVPQAYTQAPPSPPPPALQVPQVETGFVSPYEIARTLRSAGFEPLARPLREGTIYVLRATDFRGILMRVVVDARTGAIRDVNRIVPGPGRYGELGIEPPPYNPTGFEAPGAEPGEDVKRPPMRPPTAQPGTRPAMSRPPLPRPRPAALASRKARDDASGGQPQSKPTAATNTGATNGPARSARPNGTPGAQSNSEVTTTEPSTTPGAPKKTPAIVAPFND